MKFSTLFLGFFAAVFIKQGVALERTQEEAHKFLIDKGQVSANSEVETFSIDRQGQIRIRLIEDNFVYNFGLEEDQDTYNVAYMSKKKQNVHHVTQDSNSGACELTKRIGENLSILKGGTVVGLKRPSTRNRNEIEIEYKLGTKTYTITANYNLKSGGPLSIQKVVDSPPKPVNAEL